MVNVTTHLRSVLKTLKWAMLLLCCLLIMPALAQPNNTNGKPCSLKAIWATSLQTPAGLFKPKPADGYWLAGTATLVGMAMLMDQPAYNHLNQVQVAPYWQAINQLGWWPAHGVGWAAVAGVGWAAPKTKLCKVGIMGLQALATTGLMVETIKITTGRARPSSGKNAFYFAPPGTHNNYKSLVSGHSAVAWSSAHILATQTNHWWLKMLLYGAAGGVSVARVVQGWHWASDAVAGAGVGLLAAELVIRAHKHCNKKSTNLFVGANGLVWSF